MIRRLWHTLRQAHDVVNQTGDFHPHPVWKGQEAETMAHCRCGVYFIIGSRRAGRTAGGVMGDAEAHALRTQLRNAYAKLRCRCIFDAEDNLTTNDGHCPYHGSYGDPDEYDPIGDAEGRAKALADALRWALPFAPLPGGRIPLSPEYTRAHAKARAALADYDAAEEVGP